MSLFWIILLTLLLALAIWGMFDSSNRKDSIKNEIAALQNFSPDHAWYSHDWGHAMALDISRRQLALVRRTQDKLHTSIINANQIVSAEILEDGASLVKTARISQLGGAAVGGLIFGPLGAVVGGLSSGKRQIDKARSIDLDIIVQDLAAPRFTARFLATEVDKSGFVYKTYIGEAREWAARIDSLIHNA